MEDQAPATEEWVFRACMIALLYEAGHSISYLIFVSPMYFGLGKWQQGCLDGLFLIP